MRRVEGPERVDFGGLGKAGERPLSASSADQPVDLHFPILGQLPAGAVSVRLCSRTGSAGGSKPRPTSRASGSSGNTRWNTHRGTVTTPWCSPISTPNSTACRSAFQWASSGKVKNMAVSDRAGSGERSQNVRSKQRNAKIALLGPDTLASYAMSDNVDLINASQCVRTCSRL